MHAARQVFAQSYPRYLLRVVNRHEEFYALLMFLVERHYLRTQGMSQIMKSARRTFLLLQPQVLHLRRISTA